MLGQNSNCPHDILERTSPLMDSIGDWMRNWPPVVKYVDFLLKRACSLPGMRLVLSSTSTLPLLREWANEDGTHHEQTPKYEEVENRLKELTPGESDPIQGTRRSRIPAIVGGKKVDLEVVFEHQVDLTRTTIGVL